MKISVITPSVRPCGLSEVQSSLEKQAINDFEWLVEIGLPSKGNDLNAAYNRLIRRARGELIVSIQDYTSFGAELLLQLWQTFEDEPDTLYTVDVGHTDGTNIEWDWRHYKKGEPIQFMELELCVGAFGIDVIKDVGGFDEKLDELTWGYDNVNVGLRAAMKGYRLAVHPSAQAVQFKHDLKEKHPWRDTMNPELHNSRLDEIRRGTEVIWYD